MDQQLLCSWFGLEAKDWPPNHYRLLGLKPGESDQKLIEQRVHQRMDAVRCYQVCHPDQATEAMNRLAQAFVCLTEPTAKERYDTTLLGPAALAPKRPKPQTMEAFPAFGAEAQARARMEQQRSRELAPPLGKKGTVPLPQGDSPLFSQRPQLEIPPVTVSDPTPLPDELLVPPARPPKEQKEEKKADLIAEAVRSPEARQGIGTRKGLMRRIRITRQLYETWMRAEKYLGTVKRHTISKGPTANELAKLFDEIAELSSQFPRILGDAGQPGYMVVFLAQSEAVLEVATLEISQRDALRRDWLAGRNLLIAYRDFLREQAAELRLMTLKQRLGRAIHCACADQPRSFMALIGLVLLNTVVWAWYLSRRW